ncbi:hypothetical protein ACTXT7_003374 [Hymenolepis weldensis]
MEYEGRDICPKFRPFHRTEQIILRPTNATPYIYNGQAYGSVFDKNFLKSVLNLQTQVTSIRTYSKDLNKEVKLSDICFKPLEPASHECGVFSPLEYFQSNATLLDTVESPAFKGKILPISTIFIKKADRKSHTHTLNSSINPISDKGKNYLNHISFCTKRVVADNGPLGGCRGTAGVPMFGNIVFGGIKGKDYMSSEAVVITILVKNAVDHKSPTVLMAQAWESEFIRTVLKWRSEHPEIVVSFAAEQADTQVLKRSVEDEIVRQSHSDISTIAISYAVMVIYVSICLGNYRGIRTCLMDVKISLSIGGVSIVLASVFSSIGLWSFVGVPATLIIIEVIPFLVLAVGVDNIFIMVQDFIMHEQEEEVEELDNDYAEEDDDQDEDGPDYDRDAIDDVERTTSGPCIGGSCVGGKTRIQHRQKQHGDYGVKKTCTTVEARIAKTMGRVGPSMFLSSLAESVAFFCGTTKRGHFKATLKMEGTCMRMNKHFLIHTDGFRIRVIEKERLLLYCFTTDGVAQVPCIRAWKAKNPEWNPDYYVPWNLRVQKQEFTLYGDLFMTDRLDPRLLCRLD